MDLRRPAILGGVNPPVLWHFAISHFTEKARWALDWKEVPHVRKLLFMGYPVQCFLRTGQMQLPVLFWDGETILDSTRIIEHLETVKPEPALYPDDEDERRRALELEDFFDREVGPHMRSVVVNQLFTAGAGVAAEGFGMGQTSAAKWALRVASPVFRPFYRYRHNMSPAMIALGIEKIASGIEKLEAAIGPSGYLVGDRFSVADLTAASIFYPLAEPPEYPFSIPPAASEAIGAALAPFRATRAHEWVRGMYARHRGSSSAISG